MESPRAEGFPMDGPVTWEGVSALQADLKQAARALLAGEGNAGTVHTTQLVNSALKKLVPQGRDWREVSWQNRRHFFADAHQAMRRVLIQYARARKRKKRAQVRVGGFESEFLNPLAESGVLNLDRLVDQAGARAELAEAIDRALDDLDRLHPSDHLAEIVQLRSFEGLTQVEIAKVLGLSDRTVREREKFAYASLRHVLIEFFPGSTPPFLARGKPAGKLPSRTPRHPKP